MYKRHGLKVIGHEAYHGLDNWQLADKVWDFAGRDPSIQIVVDGTGNGGGVCDILRNKYKAKVREVQFGAAPGNKDDYIDFSSELWFDFDPDIVDLPEDEELTDELTNRQYDYDKLAAVR